jgi:hypothetical protein
MAHQRGGFKVNWAISARAVKELPVVARAVTACRQLKRSKIVQEI